MNTEKKKRARGPKPDHYKVVCISLYKDDLAELDRLVRALKKHGIGRANRSALIRYALHKLDVNEAAGPDGVRVECAGPRWGAEG